MAYCTVKDVTDMIKEDMYNQIIGDEYIEDTDIRNQKIQELAENAIQDASAEIDGYLSKRYQLPFQNPPEVLHKFSKDVAVYNLVSRIGIDESKRDKTFLNRYNAAIKFLTLVAEGRIEIGAYTPEKMSSTGFKMNSSNRLFSRNSMRGW